MKKRTLILYMAIFLLLLAALRLAWLDIRSTSVQSLAEQGVLDLRSWDISSNKLLALDGEWEFYPYQLLTPDSARSAFIEHNRSHIPVPANWHPYISSATDDNYHYGTYRLVILLQQEGREPYYHIRIPAIQNAATVFANGQLIAQNGQPAKEQDNFTARNIPISASIPAHSNEIELIIQVADLDYNKKGGIIKSVIFGTPTAVNQAAMFSIGQELLVCAIIMFHIFYAICLYLFGNRQIGIFYFVMMLVCAAFCILMDDNKLLPTWLMMSNEWEIKFRMSAYTWVGFFMLLFIQQLFPEYTRSKVLHGIAALIALYGAYILLFPESIVSKTGTLLLLFMLIPVLTIIVLIFRVVLRGEKSSIMLLLPAAAIASNIIWASFKTGRMISSDFYPFDLIIAFFGLSAFWLKRFVQTSLHNEQLTAELIQADKMKDDFLANTSHELRNPLYSMIHIAQSVLDSKSIQANRISPNNQTNLELLISIGRRMTQMLNDLLDLARLKEQRIRLHLSALPIHSVAAGVVDMLRYMTDGKPIEFKLAIPDHFPLIAADEHRLTQIMFNLLHNAVKYTNEGSITIRTEAVGGMAHIYVEDTGIGIQEHALSSIFQPYEQSDPDLAAAGGGLGLGLSICKQLVELHHGEIDVTSTFGQGSVFRFTIPLYANHADDRWMLASSAPDTDNSLTNEKAAADWPEISASAAEETAVAMSIDPPQIMVVDDDPSHLRVIQTILSNRDYKIVTATSGKEALTLLDKGSWHLIIIDVMMPHMSGYQLTAIIRERFSLSELPILQLAARSTSEDIYASFQSGANDYVLKPLDALELKFRVRALTDLQRSINERFRMEAAWMQAQIQPHFIFNTFNTITALSDIDLDKMRELLHVFGQYLRTSFNFHNTDQVVPLSQEVELVRAYLFIEKQRFEDRLNITWEIDERFSNLRLPPLSIQPLVENALKHGILSRARGGTVWIGIREDGDHVMIYVKDNGVGIDHAEQALLLDQPSRERPGIGLKNTDRRLKQLYGEGLRIESQLNEGTTVVFRIPR